MNQSDSSTTIAELRKLVADFVAERDWSQFHSPKNVSMALAIEAPELMEHFQWLTTDASRDLAGELLSRRAGCTPVRSKTIQNSLIRWLGLRRCSGIRATC